MSSPGGSEFRYHFTRLKKLASSLEVQRKILSPCTRCLFKVNVLILHGFLFFDLFKQSSIIFLFLNGCHLNEISRGSKFQNHFTRLMFAKIRHHLQRITWCLISFPYGVFYINCYAIPKYRHHLQNATWCLVPLWGILY